MAAAAASVARLILRWYSIDPDASMMITTAVAVVAAGGPPPEAVTVTTPSTLDPPTGRYSFW